MSVYWKSNKLYGISLKHLEKSCHLSIQFFIFQYMILKGVIWFDRPLQEFHHTNLRRHYLKENATYDDRIHYIEHNDSSSFYNVWQSVSFLCLYLVLLDIPLLRKVWKEVFTNKIHTKIMEDLEMIFWIIFMINVLIYIIII